MNLQLATFDEVKDLYRSHINGFSYEDKLKVEILLRKIQHVQRSLTRLVTRIQRYEHATGLNFTQESQRGQFQSL